jgi:hypothetical protein
MTLQLYIFMNMKYNFIKIKMINLKNEGELLKLQH